MTPVANLSFYVDWDRDGSYSHVLSNITSYVISADWTIGYAEPYEIVGGPCQLTLVLDNSTGAWNVHKSGSTFGSLLAGEALVQIRYQFGITCYLGTYKMTGVSIAPGSMGGRTATLIAQDWHNDFMGQVYDPPLTTNTRTGDAIRAMFNTVGVPGYPLGALNFILDASTLDETTRLPDYFSPGSIYLGVFPGETTLDYVGDNIDTGQGLTVLNFIREMCEAEMGGRWRFMVNQVDGRPYYTYYSRTTLALYADDGASVTITPDDFESATYTYADGLCNWIEVTTFPRKLGSAGTEIARMNSPMRIPGTLEKASDNVSAVNSRVLTLRYRDPINPDGTCAAATIIQPVASTDYTGNLAADGSGDDYTGNLVVTVENLTNAAKVTVSNTALGSVYLTLLKIRGTPLTATQSLTVNAINGASIGANGVRKLTRTIAGVDDEELTQSYANWYINNWSEPRAEYRSITFYYDDHTDAGLATFVYQTLADTKPLIIQDNWTEDTADAQSYWVSGMRCSAVAGLWSVTLILENYRNMSGFWQLENTILGVLDTSTRLAF
jgi:hypothetical protein